VNIRFVVHIVDFVGHLAEAGKELADEGGVTEVIGKLERW